MSDGDTYSGFVTEAEVQGDAAAEGAFSMIEEVAERSVCRLMRARRYGRWWALKALRRDLAGSAPHMAMMRKEFDIAVTLQHPNIVSVSGIEDVDGVGRCMVMEWIDGSTLDRWLESDEAKRSLAARRRVFAQLLSAVEYLHARQIVHRDLKPSNIMVTHNGSNVKLIDFSVADADNYAEMKQAAGTEGYMAPEQLEGSTGDLRNDIYSLGCLLRDIDLGKRGSRVARKAVGPIDSRYNSVGEMRRALKGGRLIPAIIAAIAVAAIVAAVLTFGRGDRAQPKAEPSDAAVVGGSYQPDRIFDELTEEGKRQIDARFAEYDLERRFADEPDKQKFIREIADITVFEMNAIDSFVNVNRASLSESDTGKLKLYVTDEYLNPFIMRCTPTVKAPQR